MKVFMIIPNLFLQKPSAKSKAKEHSQSLETRQKLWNEGKIMEILNEGRVIQKKIICSKLKRTPEDTSRTFSKLMFEGKVRAALRFLDENAENAVLKPSNEVLEK